MKEAQIQLRRSTNDTQYRTTPRKPPRIEIWPRYESPKYGVYLPNSDHFTEGQLDSPVRLWLRRLRNVFEKILNPGDLPAQIQWGDTNFNATPLNSKTQSGI